MEYCFKMFQIEILGWKSMNITSCFLDLSSFAPFAREHFGEIDMNSIHHWGISKGIHANPLTLPCHCSVLVVQLVCGWILSEHLPIWWVLYWHRGNKFFRRDFVTLEIRMTWDGLSQCAFPLFQISDSVFGTNHETQDTLQFSFITGSKGLIVHCPSRPIQSRNQTLHQNMLHVKNIHQCLANLLFWYFVARHSRGFPRKTWALAAAWTDTIIISGWPASCSGLGHLQLQNVVDLYFYIVHQMALKNFSISSLSELLTGSDVQIIEELVLKIFGRRSHTSTSDQGIGRLRFSIACAEQLIVLSMVNCQDWIQKLEFCTIRWLDGCHLKIKTSYRHNVIPGASNWHDMTLDNMYSTCWWSWQV